VKLVTDKPGEPPVIWDWLHRKTQLPWSSDLRCIAAMRDDGTIAGAVGFNGWTHSSCWIHVAFDGEHGLTRQLWKAAFEYPFTQCGMEAIYGQTPKNLDDALAMNRKLGFREIAQTVDCVIFEMRHDECRWLKGLKDGRQRRRTCTS
jgi:hypothetical protein